jgi:outer membrane protein insertion porin family
MKKIVFRKNNKRMCETKIGSFMKLWLWVILAVCFISPVWAMEKFLIQDIQIIGLQRISLGTTFNYLPIKVGEIIDNGNASNIIRSLYKTGFFEDIQLSRENNILKIFVEERPSIAKIEVFGNKELDTEELNEVMKQIGLTEGRIFNRSLLDQLERELNQQYLSLGKYSVKIESKLTDLERNRVEISIDIDEGEVAKIKQINLIGINAFDEEKLLNKFLLTTPTMWTGLTDSGKYSKQELLADLETLRSYYLDRGYIHFDINSSQISITPDKRDVYISINVNEGGKYTVSDVKLAGNLIVDEKIIRGLIKLNKGDVFSRRNLVDSNNKISEHLGLSGYAFANVNAVPDINDEEKTVSLTFYIEPGSRVYVRRVNITGNTKTRDGVVRREVRQMEGGWLSPSLVERSKIRLQRLGYFETVNVKTPAVEGTTDQVDLNFDVTEGSTGNFTAGLGYGQTQGLLFNTSVTLNNFLGTGKRVALELNNSKVNTVYRFSYTNPYYTKEGISRGFSLHSRSTNADEANLADFSTNNYGVSVNYGFPISEYNRASLSLGYEKTDLTINPTTAPISYSAWVAANGNEFDTIVASVGWSHDTRNRAMFPSKGYYSSISSQFATPGGDLEYYKISIRQKWYMPITKSITLKLSADLGYGDAYGDTSSLPFYENYYAGGGRTVRGYRGNTLGPRDIFTNEPIGGNVKTVGHIEVFFPSPFGEETSNTFRLSTFYDIGNVFDSEGVISADELRSAYGFSAIWLTPVGVLTFNWGWAINPKAGDELESFQFAIGAPF